MRSREQRRTQLVRDVIDGATPDPAEALRELDYDLRLHHLAAVVTAPDPDGALRELGQRLEAPHALVVSLATDTAWGWIGRTREFALPERLQAPAGTTISLGDPAAGVEGFRSSHREARDAHRVVLGAARAGAPAQDPDAGRLVRYDEVALESLVTADEARVRAFVARELRGLDGADDRSARLRRTLRAYFASAQNASAAAAMLGVHEHTVGYRLRTIEERLGRPVIARRAELETALRLLRARGD
jgi:DNA-binding PucR family transcriptional regulator